MLSYVARPVLNDNFGYMKVLSVKATKHVSNYCYVGIDLDESSIHDVLNAGLVDAEVMSRGAGDGLGGEIKRPLEVDVL